MKAVAIASIVFGGSLGQYGNQGGINCPAGFLLQGKRCERDITSQPAVFCTRGRLEGDTCVETGQQGIVCPPGTVPVDENSCKLIQQQPALVQCPNGYENKGDMCARRIEIPPIEVCNVGQRQGNQCVLEESAQQLKSRTCPPGFQDDGKNCARFREYDCTQPNEPRVAPHQNIQLQVQPKQQMFVPQPLPVQQQQTKGSPILPQTGYFGRKKRMLAGKKVYPINFVRPVPQSKGVPLKAVQTLPANQVKIARQICQEKEYAPFVTNTACPQGFNNNQGICQRITYFPLSQQCPTGQALEDCNQVETAPYQRSCVNGVLNGNACETSKTVPKQQTCPEKMTPADGICIARSAPTRQCPPGLVLHGKELCVGKEYAEPAGVVEVPCVGKECFRGV